jgi:hypothetical protein
MEVDMDLTKKTTILLSPELHRRLSQLAARRGVSLGQLVREACEARYALAGSPSRLEAVDALSKLELPVGTPEEMEAESELGQDASVQ